MLLHSFALFLWILTFLSVSRAVTLYSAPGQQALSATASADASSYTGAAAYNPTRLNPPALPNPMPPLNFPIQLQSQGTAGLSINQFPGFFGFSIEMSVSNQVLGKNSTLIQVPFLNLMATLREKSGWVNVRVGGNSQENARLTQSTIPDGRTLLKDNGNVAQNPTHTPALLYNMDWLYMMRNISDLVGVHWFLGVPFSDKNNVTLDIVQYGQQVLGEYLLAIQVGNEPDLYPTRLRDANYTQYDFFGEWGDFIKSINNNQNIINKTMLMGPSISNTHGFKDADMWATNFVQTYSANIAFLSVEHYPTDNCAAVYHTGAPINDPQTVFPSYLDHNAGVNLIAAFKDSPNFAQSQGKRYLMMETNTASCGGFAGVSDSFGAALWGVDYAMTLAYRNFSGANFHVGGQGAYYNPFTPPPTNQSSFHQWTVGPIFYSSLVVAEALGTQVTQVLDLNANNGSIYTPAYAIYENGVPVRVLLVNFMTDPSGKSNYTAAISIDGKAPSQVKTKSLVATSVSDKYNYTWGGQTFGNIFEANGRLKGDEQIVPVPCSGNTCNINVPAPGVVLVFLTDTAIENGASPTTFTTSVFTKMHNTATADKAVLATSNGMSGKDREQNMGSTSIKSANDAATLRVAWSLWGTLSAILVTVAVQHRFVFST